MLSYSIDEKGGFVKTLPVPYAVAASVDGAASGAVVSVAGTSAATSSVFTSSDMVFVLVE